MYITERMGLQINVIVSRNASRSAEVPVRDRDAKYSRHFLRVKDPITLFATSLAPLSSN